MKKIAIISATLVAAHAPWWVTVCALGAITGMALIVLLFDAPARRLGDLVCALRHGDHEGCPVHRRER